MMTIASELHERFVMALAKIVPEGHGPVDPLLRETNDPTHGDYQSNAAMGLAKALKAKPRELAERIVVALDVANLCSSVAIAGPGFINVTLSPDCLARRLESLQNDARLGVPKAATPVQHVVDFSSPNLAKEMHVGHLRTTITGESVVRVIEFQGHPVARTNHVGDWGTQFGMLLQHIYEELPQVLQNPDDFRVGDLETFYKAAKKRFDSDEAFAEASRRKVVLLQSGDPTALKVWRAFVNESLRHCHELYRWLGVTLNDVGESFYNDKLPGVIDELKKLGLAVEDKGAMCVFLDGFKNREGEPLPFIIRKTDGGYNYATTDLAALRYRVDTLKAKRIIVVTDIRQAQHFAMLYETARKAAWAGSDVRLDHIGYGMILGADKKPFKTRDGDTVKLKDLIDESVRRAREVIVKNAAEGTRTIAEDKIESVARAVGLAAIKYFDLSHNLASDYVFTWEHMLAMDGNTGPYMLYAYARIRSIGRRAGVDLDALAAVPITISHPTEASLAKVLVKFPDVVRSVADELKPNYLTEYLYGLSKAFSAFYDKKIGVPILEAPTPELKASRLALAQLTARTLKTGLGLLSIDVVEEM